MEDAQDILPHYSQGAHVSAVAVTVRKGGSEVMYAGFGTYKNEGH